MSTTSRNTRPSSSLVTLAIVAASALLAVAIAGAQSLVAVSGTIIDPSGRVLPGVSVALTDTASEARFEVRSDRDGRYRFVGVPAADYTFTVEQPGFQSVKEPLHVIGAMTRDVSMVIGTIRETLSVRGVGTAVPASDLADRRAKAKAEFDKLAAMGTAPCRASGAPTVGGNILAPRKLVDVKALYPTDLHAAGISGTVTLAAVIGTDGIVRDITDVHGPHPGLEAAAADAVREWQFSTTYLNCRPIDVRMIVTVNFLR